MIVRRHAFESCGELKKFYNYQKSLDNFHGIFQIDLPEEFYDVETNEISEMEESRLVSLADEEECVRYLLSVIGVLSEFFSNSISRKGLSKDFISLLEFGLREYRFLEKICNSDASKLFGFKNGFTWYPIKRLFRIIEPYYLGSDEAIRVNCSLWLLQQAQYLFDLRVKCLGDEPIRQKYLFSDYLRALSVLIKENNVIFRDYLYKPESSFSDFIKIIEDEPNEEANETLAGEIQNG